VVSIKRPPRRRDAASHTQSHTILAVSFCSDQQLPLTIVDTPHRIGGVQEQVQDDLLQLNAIALNRW
jgi:hypothetical protein